MKLLKASWGVWPLTGCYHTDWQLVRLTSVLMVLLVALPMLSACKDAGGGGVRVRNMADVPVDVYESTSGIEEAYILIRLTQKQEAETGWRYADIHQFRRMVFARNKAGEVIFCRRYTEADAIAPHEWLVIVEPGVSAC